MRLSRSAAKLLFLVYVLAFKKNRTQTNESTQKKQTKKLNLVDNFY